MTRPSDPHVPIRTCVGCQARRPQAELLRCVASGDRIVVDRAAAGRGAWVCGPGCLDAAQARRGFERAWRRPVPPAWIDHLRQWFADQVADAGRPVDETGDADTDRRANR